MRNDLKLFPLQVVMFPNSRITLHIFEERYKSLMSEVIGSDDEFGIVLIFDGRLMTVGTTAKVIEVSKKFENGEMDIVTEGVRRFRLFSYEIGSDDIYRGKINFLEDDNLLYDMEGMNTAVESYNKLVELAYRGNVKTITQEDLLQNDGSRSLCYKMAEKCGMGLNERQQMLEMDTEQDRLDYISTYLDNVLPKLKEAERIADIIRSDGYIQQ